MPKDNDYGRCREDVMEALQSHEQLAKKLIEAQQRPEVSSTDWLDKVVEVAAANYFAKWPAKEHGQELAFQDSIHEAFEKIGNQIGGIDATPTPVGRAGSLPGKAQAGSPSLSNASNSATPARP